MNPALAAAVEALEAERLAPVPRASHTVGVDVDDLAVILEHTQSVAARGNQAPGSDVLAAYHRLDRAVRGHAARGSGRQAAR